MKEYRVNYKVNESTTIDSEIIEAENAEEAKSLFIDWVIDQSEPSEVEEKENEVTVTTEDGNEWRYVVVGVSEAE